MIRTKPKTKARVAGVIDPDKLAGYVKRIEAVEELILAERDARADIYTEVKMAGMKPKMVRKVIRERARKAEDAAEQDELDLYRHALGMPGATYRSVAEQFGKPKSTLHRLVPRIQNGTEHDAETGEITETASGNPPDESAGTPDVTSRAGSALVTQCRECGGTGILVYDDGERIHGHEKCPFCINSESCGGTPSDRASETLEATVSEGPAHRHATGDAGTAERASLGTPLMDVASRCEPGPQDFDPGPLPSRLDRRQRAAQ